MGIYIKGLDWPELGMPIRITIFNDGAVNEEGIADYQAVEVKTPHGRLIDADAVDYDDYGKQGFTNRECVVSLIINAEQPAVIEAEEE